MARVGPLLSRAGSHPLAGLHVSAEGMFRKSAFAMVFILAKEDPEGHLGLQGYVLGCFTAIRKVAEVTKTLSNNNSTNNTSSDNNGNRMLF